MEIEVEWPSSFKASCPECGRPCSTYDHAATRWWRHLDTMNRTEGIPKTAPGGVLVFDDDARLGERPQLLAVEALVAEARVKRYTSETIRRSRFPTGWLA